MVKKKRQSIKTEKYSIAGVFLVLAFCIIVPLIHSKSTVEPVVYPRFTAIAVSVFILTILIWFENRKVGYNFSFLKKNIFIAYLLLILLSVISLFFAVNPVEGLTDIFKWILVLMFIILAVFILNSSTRTMEILLKGVILNAILASIIGIYQYFALAFQNLDPNALYEVKGLMAHKNQFSISLFLLLPFLINALISFKNIWKNLSIVALIMMGFNILILQTRAVWIALFVTILIFVLIVVLLNKRFLFLKIGNKWVSKILVIAAVVLGLVFVIGLVIPVNNPVKQATNRISTVFNPDFTSNQWRLEIWDSTLELAMDNPIIGVGAGNWKISIYPYYSEHLPSVFRHWRNPHNDYLSILSEKGFLGLIIYSIIYLILIVYSIKVIVKSKDRKKTLVSTFWFLGIIGYIIISFFSFPNDRPNHWIFISLLTAIIISEHFKLKELGKQKSPTRTTNVLFATFVVFAYMATHFGVIALNSEVYVSKAITAKENQEWKQVRIYSEKAYNYFAPIEPSSSFPISQYQGLAEYNLGNLTDALGYFKRAFSQHPTSISVINNLGSVYGQMGQMDSSIVYHKKSLEIFPHYETSLLNLTRAYYIVEDYEKAYQTILSCDPKSDNVQVNNALMAIEKELDH